MWLAALADACKVENAVANAAALQCFAVRLRVGLESDAVRVAEAIFAGAALRVEAAEVDLGGHGLFGWAVGSGAGWEVNVHHRALGWWLLECFQRDAPCMLGGGAQRVGQGALGLALALLDVGKQMIRYAFAKRNRGQIPQRAFDRASHGSRTEDQRLGGVEADVDARQDDVGWLRQQVAECDIDAVARRATDRPCLDASGEQ